LVCEPIRPISRAHLVVGDVPKAHLKALKWYVKSLRQAQVSLVKSERKVQIITVCGEILLQTLA
jgi:hypothetical protein